MTCYIKWKMKKKYDILADELAIQYNLKSRIIPYVMTWEGIVDNLT